MPGLRRVILFAELQYLSAVKTATEKTTDNHLRQQNLTRLLKRKETRHRAPTLSRLHPNTHLERLMYCTASLFLVQGLRGAVAMRLELKKPPLPPSHSRPVLSSQPPPTEASLVIAHCIVKLRLYIPDYF